MSDAMIKIYHKLLMEKLEFMNQVQSSQSYEVPYYSFEDLIKAIKVHYKEWNKLKGAFQKAFQDDEV